MKYAFTILYFVAVTFGLWGFAAGRYEVFPYRLFRDAVREIEAFLSQAGADKTSVAEKLLNDAGLKPYRHLRNITPSPSGQSLRTQALPDRSLRRAEPTMYLDDVRAQRGYRLLLGVLDFDSSLHGALLFSPSGEIVHTWKIADPHATAENIFPHGFDVLPDGSILVGFDMGKSSMRLDWCGKQVWIRDVFHHSITLTEDRKFAWALGDLGSLVMFDVIDGLPIRKFSVEDIMNANQHLDLFGVRQNDDNFDMIEWVDDGGGRWHENDLEALPDSMAQAFPDFERGDLALSLRSLNLVLVISPATLQVKWWSFGQVRRQHDPDWQSDGTITVFDNNSGRAASRIVRIDPRNSRQSVLVDGAKLGFASRIRGKHQVLPNGNVLVTSSEQGRVFEVTPDGEVVFDFINHYDVDAREVLVLSEAKWLPEDFFTFQAAPVCAH